MKWVVLAIVAFLVPYTFLTLHFRKPGPEFEPYAEGKTRAITLRLLSNGYQRITLAIERPADPPAPSVRAVTAAAPGGLTPALAAAIIDHPGLPETIDRVTAAPEARAAAPYVVEFTCGLPDKREQLADARLYRRGSELVVVASFERLDDALQARTRESTLVVTVPAGARKPGRYRMTVAGARASRQWTLQVH